MKTFFHEFHKFIPFYLLIPLQKRGPIVSQPYTPSLLTPCSVVYQCRLVSSLTAVQKRYPRYSGLVQQ